MTKTLILGCIRTILHHVAVIALGMNLGAVNSDVMLGMWIDILTSAGIMMVWRLLKK